MVAVVKKNEVDLVLDLLNSAQYASIKFTMEKEVNGCLPFLDLKLIHTNTGIEFDIFRKETSTYQFIPSDSYHNAQHKYAAFNTMVHKLLSIPLSDELFDKEFQHIQMLYNLKNVEEKEKYNTDAHRN